jgi:hypothetical protein
MPSVGAADRVAVLAHGSGSTADFVRRAFGRACAAARLELVTWDDRTGDVDVVAAELGRLATATGARVVGGVSLGAHAAARWAAGRDLDGVLLALPAWSGPPGAAAALSLWAADDIERRGLPAVLGDLRGQGWVGAELAVAWHRYGETTLLQALRATAASSGPSSQTLARVEAPTGVLALAGDAFHPEQVAVAWTSALPHAVLARLEPSAPAADIAVLGDSVVRAWLQARESISA